MAMSKATTWGGFLVKLVKEHIPSCSRRFWAEFKRVLHKYREGIIISSFIACGLCFVAGFVWLMSIASDQVGENLKAQRIASEKAAAEKKAEEEANRTPFTIDDALSTVKNSVSADKICYDEKQNGYLMYWKQPTKGNTREGWYIMTNVDFYPMSNGKFFIKNVNAIPDEPITPDSVEGLPCIEGRGR